MVPVVFVTTSQSIVFEEKGFWLCEIVALFTASILAWMPDGVWFQLCVANQGTRNEMRARKPKHPPELHGAFPIVLRVQSVIRTTGLDVLSPTG